MGFYNVLDQVLELVCQRGRVSYHALKREFNLDDRVLEDLKKEIVFAHPQIVDEGGRGLVWTSHSGESESEVRWRLDVVLVTVIALLRCEKRVTYRALKQIFDVDDVFLEALRKELVFKQVARDEQGKGLVWTGEEPPHTNAVTTARLSIDSDFPSPVAQKGSAPVTEPPPPSAMQTVIPDRVLTTPLAETRSEAHDEGTVATLPPLRPAPEAERRQLTVMFCDLVGSTDLSVRLDPEDLREVVRAYQEMAAEVIQRYEGHIAQYLGDGLLVYFGYPLAHEDDAQRAVYTGLGISEAIATLNTRLEAAYGVQLAVRIGIHTGLVVVGEMGGGSRHENLALGETPNIAARLEGLAEPNTAVISPITAQLVQRSFILEEVGFHELKGVVGPMKLFHVVGPREAEQAPDTALRGRFEVLVGRNEEIGLLLRRWEQSKEGLGQVVLLSGEPGIGKSSLVDGLWDHVRKEGLKRIALRCSPYTTNSALYPIIEHVRRVLVWQPEDATDTPLVKLEHELGSTSLPLEETVPLLASLLSLSLPEGRYPALTLSPQQQRQQTQDVLVAWLLEEAERQAVLAVWEDLHWSDPSTLEMLGVLIDQTPTVAMLHVLTFRPEFMPPWPLRSHMTPLTLNRLERPQAEAMIAHQAHGKTLPPEVIEHIIAKTDGVPLFVEELTKMILESTLLRDEGEHFELTGPLSSVAIPATLQDSLMARLDRLPTVRVVAQLGAIIGREFDYEMIQALGEVEETTLQAGLAQLVGAELLYQRGRPPRARYIFKHALVQDAAYASLLRSTRRQYHQQVAQLLETRFPQTVATELELVAHHYTEAGLIEKAIIYWQRAGERANDRSANPEARSHLTKGLDLLRTLPESPARLQSELALQTTLGRVLTAANGYGNAEVVQVYTRARQLCQQIGDTPQLFPVLLGLSIYFVVRAELHTARELGEQLLSLAQRAQDPVRLVEAHYSLGVTFSWLGDFVLAREHLEQGSAHYDPAQHLDHLALYGQDGGPVCLCRLAFVLWSLGYPDQALSRGHEALDIAQELSHPYSLAYVLTWVAILYHHCRTVQEAQQWIHMATTFSTEQGFPFWYTQGIVLQGWVLTEQDRVEEGIAQMQQGLIDLQAVGTEILQAYYLGLLASTHGKVGQPEVGLALLEEALAKVNTSDERWSEAELHRLRGELLLQEAPSKKVQEAEASFLQALDVAKRQHAKSPQLRAATNLARLWQSQGKRNEAHELLAPVYNWFTEGFDTADLQEAKMLLSELV